MCSESLTPSGTSAPAALKQPQWVFIWKLCQCFLLPIFDSCPKCQPGIIYLFTPVFPVLYFLQLQRSTPILLQAPSSESSLPNHTIFSTSSQNTPFSVMLWLKPGLSAKCCCFFSRPHLNYLTWLLPAPFSLFQSWTFITSIPKLLPY